MDSRHEKIRNNVEGDRLSSLPDDLIHKILSFISIKYAIQTSSLSSRWRFVWTSMPYLNFWSWDFHTLPKFSKFVAHVLSRRNNQVEVSSVNLRFRGKFSQVFVKRIMNYSFSHNVQQLTVDCLPKNGIQFPLSLFRSRSLKHLSLTPGYELSHLTLTSTWELPALTTLYVSCITFCDDDNTTKCSDLLSKCMNLENLTLRRCSLMGSELFSVCHPRLSNLKLEDCHPIHKVINVVAPQLENLIIIRCRGEHVISAPNLASLVYKDNYPFQLSTDGFHSLEKVDLCFRGLCKADACKIVGLLQQVQSTKFLTLNMEIVELLSSSPELLSLRPSPFANLKSLKIYPYPEVQLNKKAAISTEVINYLLDHSPSATFTMVSLEEIMAMRNAKLAQDLMKELQELLEQKKVNCETNRTHIERGKAQIQVQHEEGKAQVEKLRAPQAKKIQERLGGKKAHIEYYLKELESQIKQGKAQADHIHSKLLQIEGLLMKMPTWQKIKMEARFSNLCAGAYTVMNDIIECTKIQFDKEKCHLNAYLCEHATSSHPSS